MVLKLIISAILLAIACAISGCSLDIHTGFGYHGKTGEDNNVKYTTSTLARKRIQEND